MIIGAGTIAITEWEGSSHQSWPQIHMGYQGLCDHTEYISVSKPVGYDSIMNGRMCLYNLDCYQPYQFEAGY